MKNVKKLTYTSDNSNKKKCMNFNVILSFNQLNEDGESQEFFDISIPLSERDGDVMAFLNSKFFPRIVKACIKFDRSPQDLVKISTCAAWSVYEKVAKRPCLMDYGHDGKWYFGIGRNDMDIWERYLAGVHGFGAAADMSWVEEQINAMNMSANSKQAQPPL